jgi:hypothetical protein
MFHDKEIVKPTHHEDDEMGKGTTRVLNKDKDDDNMKSTTFKTFEQSAILDCESDATSLLLFHPFEAVLVMSDLRDGLSVWNYGYGYMYDIWMVHVGGTRNVTSMCHA